MAVAILSTMPWWTCFNCINLKNPDDVLTLDFSHCLLFDVPPDVFQYERTLEELYLNSNRVSFYSYGFNALDMSAR